MLLQVLSIRLYNFGSDNCVYHLFLALCCSVEILLQVAGETCKLYSIMVTFVSVHCNYKLLGFIELPNSNSPAQCVALCTANLLYSLQTCYSRQLSTKSFREQQTHFCCTNLSLTQSLMPRGVHQWKVESKITCLHTFAYSQYWGKWLQR